MARAELVEQRIDAALNSLRTYPEQANGINVGRAAAKVRRGEVPMLDTRAIAALTDFRAAYEELPRGFQVMPGLPMNGDKILKAPPQHLEADLVRTLAVLDQYPSQGFERRLVDVYGAALETQTNWLTEKSLARVPNDPRHINREAFIRQLLGDALYFADSGVEDYQAAFDKFSGNGTALRGQDSIRGDVRTFIALRTRYTSSYFQETEKLLGKRLFRELDRNERASRIGEMIAVTASLSWRPSN